MRLLFVAFIAAAVLAVPIALLSRQHHSPAAKPIRVLIGIDHSRSARGQESAAAYQVSSIDLRLNPLVDLLTLYRVDHDVREFFDGQPPASREKLLQLIVQELEKITTDPGTRPALFWREVANRAADAKGPVCIVFFSDGDNDDLSHRSKLMLNEAAAALARNPNVIEVAVIGARPENWAGLRSQFSLLEDRLVLSTSAFPNLDQIANTIDHVRNNYSEVTNIGSNAR